jgi:hypothetical protein
MSRKACDIKFATVNGQAVKVFEVRELLDRVWIFRGIFTAPRRVANKRLLEFVSSAVPTPDGHLSSCSDRLCDNVCVVQLERDAEYDACHEWNAP